MSAAGAVARVDDRPLVGGLHPEDVKAILRKRFGTLTRFEQLNGLPDKSVSEILRGRKSARVANAIEAALTEVPSKSSHEDSAAPANNTPAEVAA